MGGYQSPIGAPTKDWLQHDAAVELAEKISRYWAQRGRLVRTWVTHSVSAELPGNQRQIWSVRSDLTVASGVWRKQ